MSSSHKSPTIPALGRVDVGVGTVAAAREDAVQAGMEMLERGGNAVDAAVAAALVAGVVEPSETTLAGSGFLLLNDPAAGRWSVEFGPRAPRAATADMFRIDADAAAPAVLGVAAVVDNANADGPLAMGVPRTLNGLVTAHERWGALDRAVVFAPAIALAEEGFRADTWHVMNVVADRARLMRDPAARAIFFDVAGGPVGMDSNAVYGRSFGRFGLVRQPALAETLREVVAGGSHALTEGVIAQELLRTFQEYGAIVDAEDLRTSGPDIGHPLSLRFRDVDVSVPRAPGGGITELQMLAIWQALYPDGSPQHDDAARTRSLALALQHAFADRYHWLGDPDVVAAPNGRLLDPRYAAFLAATIAGGPTPPFAAGGAPWTRFAVEAAHDPWAVLGGGEVAPQWCTPASAQTSGTTHISVADADRRIVSVTHTAANHFGSGVMCPRTGLLFDSAMAWFNAVPGSANSIRGGARPVANMGPAMVTRDETSIAAVGASGGRRILSAVAQTLINLIDRQQSPLEALQQPRIDGSGAALLLHDDLADLADDLADFAPEVVPAGVDGFTIDFARVNVAAYLGDRRTASAVDARSYSA